MATLRFESSWHRKRMILQNFLLINENMLRNIPLSSIAFLILKDILQSLPFLMSPKFKTQNCHWYEVKQIKSILAGKGNSGTRIEVLLYYLT